MRPPLDAASAGEAPTASATAAAAAARSLKRSAPSFDMTRDGEKREAACKLKDPVVLRMPERIAAPLADVAHSSSSSSDPIAIVLCRAEGRGDQGEASRLAEVSDNARTSTARIREISHAARFRIEASDKVAHAIWSHLAHAADEIEPDARARLTELCCVLNHVYILGPKWRIIQFYTMVDDSAAWTGDSHFAKRK
eukprot:4604272-Pleurochrysis_carterae.AAC.1